VDRSVFLDALDATVLASKFVTYKGSALRERDYRPTFTTTNMGKDLGLSADLAESAGVVLPLGSVVRQLVGDSVAAGYGADDFLSLFCVQQAASGLAVDLEREASESGEADRARPRAHGPATTKAASGNP
jgi:hypothetical protein